MSSIDRMLIIGDAAHATSYESLRRKRVEDVVQQAKHNDSNTVETLFEAVSPGTFGQLVVRRE